MSPEQDPPAEPGEELSSPETGAPDGMTLPEVLPVLPLRNTVLFPTRVTRTPMIATTERAKRLIEDALEGSRLLVAVAARDAEIEEPGVGDLYPIGTAVHIEKTARGEDGSLRLWVQGLKRVRIGEYVGTDPYPSAAIEVLEDDYETGSSVELEALQRTVSSQFVSVSDESSTVSEAVRALVPSLGDAAILCDVVAANLSLGVPDQQELLEMTVVRERLERLAEHLAREQEVRRLERDIREQVQEELSRSQREYVLREQARAIRRQLGEYDSPEDQVDDLRARLERPSTLRTGQPKLMSITS